MTDPAAPVRLTISRADAEQIRESLESDGPWLGGKCDELADALDAALAAAPPGPPRPL
jgi:hypothetical protein